MGYSMLRSFGCATCVGTAFLSAGGTAFGQHHHHHHDHHPVHVHSAPVHTHVVQPPHVHYVQPMTPLATGVAPVNVAPSFQGAGMVVSNPRGNSGTVNFTLDGQTYTLEPGYQISLKTRPSYSIAFGRGDGGAAQSYTLSDGKIYNFSAASGVWDVREASPAAAQAAVAPTAPSNAAPVNAAPVAPAASGDSLVQTVFYKPADEAPPAVARSFVKGNTVQVAAEAAEIRNGSSVLATAPRGKSFKVLEVKDKWVMVDFGGTEYGWVNGRNLRLADAEDDAPLAVNK